LRRIVRGIIRESSDIGRSSWEMVSRAARDAGATEAELAAVEDRLPEIEVLVREFAMATNSGDAQRVLDIMVEIDELYKDMKSSYPGR
jgi:predicted translin family RNA/ssDNA-binding protein